MDVILADGKLQVNAHNQVNTLNQVNALNSFFLGIFQTKTVLNDLKPLPKQASDPTDDYADKALIR